MIKITSVYAAIFLSLAFVTYSPNVRDTFQKCEELTNNEITKIQNYEVGERKPLLVSAIQTVCERVETGEASPELLDLIYASYLDNFRIDQGVKWYNILGMGITHQLSPSLLQFKIDKNSPPLEGSLTSFIWSAGNSFERQSQQLGVKHFSRVVRIGDLENKGSTAKVHVTDLQTNQRWLLKWGDEVHTDPVASRIFASLGFNTDLPTYYGPNELTILLGKTETEFRTPEKLVHFMYNSYGINLSPFITKSGVVSQEMVRENPSLQGFEGESFINCTGNAVEPRSDSEVRLGSIMSDRPEQLAQPEVQGALLAHLWIDSWDTKEDNTLLSLLAPEMKLRGSYSDIGVSLGVKINKFPRDLKGGLVNEFSWDLVKKLDDKIVFNSHINYYSAAYRHANYQSLRWMAEQIGKISPDQLIEILRSSGWPEPIQKLYFYKLAERRRQILDVFEIQDRFHYEIDKSFSASVNGEALIAEGSLLREPDLNLYPEGLYRPQGRLRNYGW